MNTERLSRLEEIVRIREEVKKHQKHSRYEHTLGVAYTAASLAMVHGEDPLRAELAGILHDCAKGYTDAELIGRCEAEGVKLSEEILASPAVIHAIYGARLAKTKYGIEDPEILQAVWSHTTGRPGMSRLEKIIYIADFIEPLRDEAPNLPKARKLAFEDLDRCMLEILGSTISYLEGKGAPVVSATREAHRWFLEHCPG